jgi:hypothetical protein
MREVRFMDRSPVSLSIYRGIAGVPMATASGSSASHQEAEKDLESMTPDLYFERQRTWRCAEFYRRE